MISQAQAVEAARRALSLCVTLLSRSPDSVTDNAASDYYVVVWDSAYSVWVSKQTDTIRRILTSRTPAVVARRQHAPIARIKSEKDFAAWQDLVARQFQTPRDTLPLSSEVTLNGFNVRLVPYDKNRTPLPFFNTEPGLRLSVMQTEEGPHIDARNEWRYDFEPGSLRQSDPMDALIRARDMLIRTDMWQKSFGAVSFPTNLSVNPVYAREKLEYIVDGKLKPNYYSKLKIRSIGDEIGEKYPQRLVVAWGVVVGLESFAFRAADGRLISFVPGDPT